MITINGNAYSADVAGILAGLCESENWTPNDIRDALDGDHQRFLNVLEFCFGHELIEFDGRNHRLHLTAAGIRTARDIAAFLDVATVATCGA